MPQTKEIVELYYELDNNGKLKRIRTPRDKGVDDDFVDNTVTFYAKMLDGRVERVSQYVLPADAIVEECPVGFRWDLKTRKCVPRRGKGLKFDLKNRWAGTTGEPFTVSASFKQRIDAKSSIVWSQVGGPTVEFNVSNDRKSVRFIPRIKGDYSFSLSVKTGSNIFVAKATVEIRDNPPESPEVKLLLEDPFDTAIIAAGDFSCSDDAANIMEGIRDFVLKGAKIIALGDYPYGKKDAKCFTDEWSKHKFLPSTVAAVIGNHEDPDEDGNEKIFAQILKYFSLASNGLSKTVIGNIACIGMNTQDPKIEDENGKQYGFVRTALEEYSNNPQIDWIIVASHKPFYSTGKKHDDEKDIREIYQPLFDRNGVDIVLHGHNHNAYATFPLTSNGQMLYTEPSPEVYNFDQTHGQIYLGAGNGGRDHHTNEKIPRFIKFSNDSDYGFIAIDQARDNPLSLRIRILDQHGENLLSENGKKAYSIVLEKTAKQSIRQAIPLLVSESPNTSWIAENGVLQIYPVNQKFTGQQTLILGFGDWERYFRKDDCEINGSGKGTTVRVDEKIRRDNEQIQIRASFTSIPDSDLPRDKIPIDIKKCNKKGYMFRPTDFTNIEMSATMKIHKKAEEEDFQNFVLYGPSWEHPKKHRNPPIGCMGTCYKSEKHYGRNKVRQSKEQYHVNYKHTAYETSPGEITEMEYMGLKHINFLYHNSDGNKCRRLETWENLHDNSPSKNRFQNKWILRNVSEDEGNSWGDAMKDCGCDSNEEAILTGGPLVTYRWDHSDIEGCYWTVQEIEPPEPDNFYKVGTIIDDNDMIVVNKATSDLISK